MKNVSRFIVSLAAVLFAGIGIGFWVVPVEIAARFGFEATGGAGLANVRADLGGLFLGLAVLCGLGAWFGRRSALLAAAALLAAIVAGRILAWIVDGEAGIDMTQLAIELVALAALVSYSRAFRALPAVPEPRMSRGLKIVTTLVVVLATGAGAAMLNPTVGQKIFDRGATRLSARVNTAPLADDALRVAIAGSSAPLPSKERAKACVVVFAGGKMWVVDAGPESVENLLLWGVPLSEVQGVLITHFHSDHIGDLGELQLQTWAGGRTFPLAVYGGPGVQGVVDGFNTAYRLDQGYRTGHHGESVMPSAAWGMMAHTVLLDGEPTGAKDRTGLVYDDGKLRITAIEVDHAPIEPAYAYRFDYKGRSVVVTGDLKYHPPLVKSAARADLLVSEAISRNMTQSLEDAARSGNRERNAAIMHDVQDYHISPEEAATIANEADVKLLVYYHLLPAPDKFLTRRLFSQGVNDVRRNGWTIAEDGSLYTLPIGSEKIERGKIG